MDNQTTNNNLKKLTKRSDAENPNLKKMVESGMSRDNTIMPSGLIFDGLSYNAIRNKKIKSKGRPIDIGGGAIDWSKSYQGNIDLLGRRAEDEVPEETLLLDEYPNASAAYSLKKLRSDYSGAAIEVRIDTTGQPVYDIGFDSNGKLDTTDLLSKAGANDAYVSAWYDQQGSNDLIQTTASRQPRIVNAGNIELLNGNPAIYADGIDDNLLTTSTNINVIGTNGVQSVFAAAQINNDSSLLCSYFDGGDSLLYPIGYFDSVGGLLINPPGNSFDVNTNYTLGSYTYVSAIVTDSTVEIFSNGTSDGSVANTGAIGGYSRITVFARNYSAFQMEGYARTLVIYNSDQSANREAIETNINDHPALYNFEQALEFDGVDDFADLPFSLTSPVQTISAWIKIYQFDVVDIILGGESGVDYFRYQHSQLRFQVRSDAGNSGNFTVPPLSLNTWYHVFYADNGTQGRFFLNGVESSSGAVSTGNNYNWTKIGNQATRFLDGVLDDVLLTNTYGDPVTESAAIYNGGAGADPLSVIPTAQQLYRFNNNTNNDGNLGGSGTLNNFVANPYVPHT